VGCGRPVASSFFSAWFHVPSAQRTIRFMRRRYTLARKHSGAWSSTIPTACMNA
jgi:hypothetical protein